MKVISTDNAPAAIGPYSQAIVAGGFLYTSGQLPIDPATGEFAGSGIAEQAKQSLENIKAVTEAAGGTLNNVVKTTCFLADMSDFAEFNKVYSEYFTDNKPSRSCVAVKQLPRNALVEVEAVVLLG